MSRLDWTVQLNEAPRRYEISRQTFKDNTGIDDSSVTVLSAISKLHGSGGEGQRHEGRGVYGPYV